MSPPYLLPHLLRASQHALDHLDGILIFDHPHPNPNPTTLYLALTSTPTYNPITL